MPELESHERYTRRRPRPMPEPEYARRRLLPRESGEREARTLEDLLDVLRSNGADFGSPRLGRNIPLSSRQERHAPLRENPELGVHLRRERDLDPVRSLRPHLERRPSDLDAELIQQRQYLLELLAELGAPRPEPRRRLRDRY